MDVVAAHPNPPLPPARVQSIRLKPAWRKHRPPILVSTRFLVIDDMESHRLSLIAFFR